MTNKQHKAMWEEIAFAYLTPKEEKTGWQYRISGDGLCHALTFFGFNINFAINKLFGNNVLWCNKFLSTYRLHPSYDKLPRGDVAYLFSLMTKTEFEKMVGYKYNGKKI